VVVVPVVVRVIRIISGMMLVLVSVHPFVFIIAIPVPVSVPVTISGSVRTFIVAFVSGKSVRIFFHLFTHARMVSQEIS
jgi:hypothetical protein